jgi:hypothetical protein
MRRRAVLRALPLIVGALAVGPAWAASAPIYKCFDAHLSLVYTDLPCKDGELVDIRAGDADPAAVARLERAREALDQSAAQRMADERRATDRRAAYGAPAPMYDPGEQPMAGAADYGYGYALYPSYRRHPVHRPRSHEMRQKLGFAPRPPYIVPRH